MRESGSRFVPNGSMRAQVQVDEDVYTDYIYDIFYIW